jgi:DNA-binding beta-propeller fold protein YncE
MAFPRSTVIVLLFVAGGLQTAMAQRPAPDTVVTGGSLVGHFEDAQSVALDPAGRLYVADAGRDAVVRLSPVGSRYESAALGGSGTGEGEFDAPADVDPTNGLVIVVADAGNARLQRFSAEFQHLESLPVQGDATAQRDPARGQPVYQRTDPGLQDFGDGRPVSVAVNPSDETFALDGDRGVVVKWDAARRVVRVWGGFEDGARRLTDPVALAYREDRLYVADPGRGAVVVYDEFGGPVRTLARPLAEGVRNVAADDEALYVVLPRRVLTYSLRGRLRRVTGVNLDAPLVDAAPSEDALFLLTASRLLRLEL